MASTDRTHFYGDDCEGGHKQMSEVDRFLGQLDWLMENSEGVVGLRMDGGVMPWSEVRKLYLPAWPEPKPPPVVPASHERRAMGIRD